MVCGLVGVAGGTHPNRSLDGWSFYMHQIANSNH